MTRYENAIGIKVNGQNRFTNIEYLFCFNLNSDSHYNETNEKFLTISILPLELMYLAKPFEI